MDKNLDVEGRQGRKFNAVKGIRRGKAQRTQTCCKDKFSAVREFRQNEPSNGSVLKGLHSLEI